MPNNLELWPNMHWIEPKSHALVRAKTLSFPSLSMFISLFVFAASLIAIRVILQTWQVLLSVIIGVSIGYIYYLLRIKNLSTQQEININEKSIIIKGNITHELTYAEIKGHSIIDSELKNKNIRSLIIFPSVQGQYAIGISGNISNRDIVNFFKNKATYVTYINK